MGSLYVVRELKRSVVEEASSLTKEIMIDSWERFEKEYYPKKALEFDISQQSPKNHLKELEAPSSFCFVADGEGDRALSRKGVS